MNFHEEFDGHLGQTYEQQIITNEAEIPVMVLVPFNARHPSDPVQLLNMNPNWTWGPAVCLPSSCPVRPRRPTVSLSSDSVRRGTLGLKAATRGCPSAWIRAGGFARAARARPLHRHA